MKLSCNTVACAKQAVGDALQAIAWAGYDGVEFSPMHLSPGDPEAAAAAVARARELGLEPAAIEAAANLFDEGARQRLYTFFALAARLGIPLVTTGSGGPATEEGFDRFVNVARQVAREAEQHGVTWALKAHVGAAAHCSADLLRLLPLVGSSRLRVNFDATHLQREGEDPVASAERLAAHTGHVHIRSYDSPDKGIGSPWQQIAGRGRVDLPGVVGALRRGGYDGVLSLEIIGAQDWEPVRQMAIIAESRGYLHRLLQEG